MPPVNVNQGLVPSLIDRLSDSDSEGTSWQRGYSPRQMMEAVRRDLEDLFNTHCSSTGVPDHYREVLSSVVGYGLPDLPALYNTSMDQGQDICRLVTEIITRFEPRLRDVRVILVDSVKNADHRARFHIEAGLNVDPSPEVAFETILELATGHTSVRAGGS